MTPSVVFVAVAERPELLAPCVLEAVELLQDCTVAEIDPAYMNGLALSEHYGLNPHDGANCIIVRGKLDDSYIYAALVVRVGYRADLKGRVCEVLGVKKVSMAPLDEVLAQTGMEYGSITPIGLPLDYRILVDSAVLHKDRVIIGGGKQISKISLPTKVFLTLHNTEVIDGLALSSAPETLQKPTE